MTKIAKEPNVSLFLLSLNTLLPHSTARLSARHGDKGQTRVLSVTHGPAMTHGPQIHQGTVISEFTGVILFKDTDTPSAM